MLLECFRNLCSRFRSYAADPAKLPGVFFDHLQSVLPKAFHDSCRSFSPHTFHGPGCQEVTDPVFRGWQLFFKFPDRKLFPIGRMHGEFTPQPVMSSHADRRQSPHNGKRFQFRLKNGYSVAVFVVMKYDFCNGALVFFQHVYSSLTL